MSTHHVSPVANSTSYTLSEAIQEAPASDNQTTTQNQYTCCPWTFCLYTDPEGRECLELINCSTVPDHFKDKHGIANLARGVELVYMLGGLLMQTNPSYTWEDELFGGYWGGGGMTAVESARRSCARYT
ncbi:hypothetical protein BKA83DRAFT_4120687 [Pisolithus microcarpus]|nr:hypothetical protein BKA83DRAFT_4128148 [Pisolithus microcarpus]KAI6037114.1 hypothetical protein BKA83DRAFT_4120687 [Pisolithus microcarpus]